jgi:hypothetical protein
MNSRHAIAAVLLAVVALAQAARADDHSVARSALEFQTARFQAMIDEDMESLEQFLADDLTYSHTTGWTETKSEFLTTVESGKIDYVSVTPRDVEVRVYHSVAVITGLADMRGAVDDRELSFTIRFLDVSRRVDGAWQLVAWQSVRIPENNE